MSDDGKPRRRDVSVRLVERDQPPPSAGLYGDYYFSTDDVVTAGLTTMPLLHGWFGRAAASLAMTFSNSAALGFPVNTPDRQGHPHLDLARALQRAVLSIHALPNARSSSARKLLWLSRFVIPPGYGEAKSGLASTKLVTRNSFEMGVAV